MSAAAIQLTGQNVATAPSRSPAVPWRDPHTVSPDLRTCLSMAHAMNYDAYRSMDALDAARELDPNHFFAQLKYAELHYRLRALVKAERETLRAGELARNAWELSLSRHQLREIRRLMREGTQEPEWTKSLTAPSVALALMLAVVFLAVVLR